MDFKANLELLKNSLNNLFIPEEEKNYRIQVLEMLLTFIDGFKKTFFSEIEFCKQNETYYT